jgi:NAD-dependent SIR2 family protein deacetylase
MTALPSASLVVAELAENDHFQLTREQMMLTNDVAEAAAVIRGADGILITAGAGIGVDSGLPDFRGDNGFWKAYPALGVARIRFHEIANPSSFRATPHLGWGFYGHRLQLYRDTVPHEGFAILCEFVAPKAQSYFVYTSNVDGQFQKAGFAPDRVVECHGSIHHSQCLDNCTDEIWRSDVLVSSVDPVTCLMNEPLPRCRRCGGLSRPNILMFNDSEWLQHRTESQHALFDAWLATVQQLVVIEIGAGTNIPSVRRLGERQRAPLIRINPRDSAVEHGCGLGLPLGALDALRLIRNALALP